MYDHGEVLVRKHYSYTVYCPVNPHTEAVCHVNSTIRFRR